MTSKTDQRGAAAPEAGTPAVQAAVAPAAATPAAAAQQRASALAHRRAAPGPGRRPTLLDRLQRQAALVRSLHAEYSGADSASALPHAAEWLLDNLYVLQRAWRQIAEDLPPRYYDELPKLAAVEQPAGVAGDAAGDAMDPLDGYPRAYALALDIIEVSHGRLDMGAAVDYLDAYQQITPLTMGELWALPTMLRMGQMDLLVEGLTAGGDPDAALLPHWPDAALLADVHPDDRVADAVLGLRAIDAQEWADFFEAVSLVERTLRRDPAGLYAQCTPETRDHCRAAVEEAALWAGRPELEAAELAVELAAAESDPAARERHAGYFLLDAGRLILEERLGSRPPLPARLRRRLRRRPTAAYLGTIALFTAALLAVVVAYLRAVNADAGHWLAALLISLPPALHLAVGLTNWAVTKLLLPTHLPKLDFSRGIPARHRTAVVIPALLTSSQEARSLVRQLEQHYLINPDPELRYALLTDFADAAEQETPADRALLEEALALVNRLNEAYPHAPFHLLHRRRLWNERENVWMGWERKRGKLEEFNRLLLSEGETTFAWRAGEPAELEGVRYVITLDADTVLGGGGPARLVGALAHPLNRPEADPESGIVRRGYAVLQPRAAIKPASANQTLFARTFSGDVALDLYSRAVSDAYMDLFGEGIYVGKGIYDVAAFGKALAGRTPENALLSHDLFEGLHARAGLISDVVVYEEYPPAYLVHMRRLHRWVRGDWQLLPWLGARVPAEGGGSRPSVFSAIDRWKIVDNLRRSLLAPALLAMLLLGWLWLPGNPAVWTLLALGALTLPTLLAAINGLAAKRPNLPTATLRTELTGVMLQLAFLPYTALIDIDAIATSLARLTISRRRMLEWTTASHTLQLFGRRQRVAVAWMNMASAPAVTVLFALAVWQFSPEALPVAAPIMLVWLISPQIAYAVSLPALPPVAPLDAEQTAVVRRLARRTWLFYEHFVGPEDNWLPPDHFQEQPLGRVAHRTSPTNIGLTLLSVLAAYDFGYVGMLGFVQRIEDTLASLDKLECYRGHLLNWYDTVRLSPLPPRYVSTVDSGNLAAALLALRQGCLELVGRRPLRHARVAGMEDLLGLLRETLAEIEAEGEERGPHLAPLYAAIDAASAQLAAVADDPAAWPGLLARQQSETLPALLVQINALAEAEAPRLAPARFRSLRVWSERLHNHVVTVQREWSRTYPALPAPPLAAATPAAQMRAVLFGEDAAGPPLDQLPAAVDEALAILDAWEEDEEGAEGALEDALGAEGRAWIEATRRRLAAAADEAAALTARLRRIAESCDRWVTEMDFGFLYDQRRDLFHIGFNVDTGRLDANYYDLLASEARLASVVAVGKNDVPRRHWLHMARPLASMDGRRMLLSWSGTMFEYLMPDLLLRSYPGSLLTVSSRAAVDQQIAYGRRRGTPWGISESGYYHFDDQQGYQYRAFGVPGMGFKRGLGDDLVIAPYASALALPLAPGPVLENLEALAGLGARGLYGFYEAVDYTGARLPAGQEYALVREYMVHHHGMALLAMANSVHDKALVRRFHADPRVRSVELLLQEVSPHSAPLETLPEEGAAHLSAIGPGQRIAPWPAPPQPPMPQAHLLSNGRLSTLITSAGGGYSAWRDRALTRWRADSTCEAHGVWLYVQDRDSGDLWSPAAQPCPAREEGAVRRSAHFAPHLAGFTAERDGLSVNVEVAVAPRHDVEMRRVRLVNQSGERRRLALVSYGEVILSDQEADRRHPAFNKLFISADFDAELRGLVFERRPRAANEQPPSLAHFISGASGPLHRRQVSADRASFLGRAGDAARPAALTRPAPLDGVTGNTLDPAFALRYELELPPYGAAELAFCTAVAPTRPEVEELARRFRDLESVDRAVEQAANQATLELLRLEMDGPALAAAQRLLSALVYPQPGLRGSAAIAANRLGQSGLWPYAISGDYPILLVRLSHREQLPVAREALRAHQFWRGRGAPVDLVLLDDETGVYMQETRSELVRMLARTGNDAWLNRRGGVFVLGRDQLRPQDMDLLESAARVILDGDGGDLERQAARLGQPPSSLPPFTPPFAEEQLVEPTPPLPRPSDLLFDNGLGGFSPDGREYQVYLPPGETTPAPWTNVIANPEFGFIVTALGAGNTWAGNSGENRLTPWRNDAAAETTGEALYLRDEETGEVWTPTPQPAPATGAAYLVRHGAGYSVFHSNAHGLEQELTLFVAADAPVKLARLRLTNRWARGRRLTATYYAEWVLGVDRDAMQQYITPEYDQEHGALLARNAYHPEYGGAVAFLAADHAAHGLTCDRTEFLGRLGNLAAPAALRRIGLSGRVEPGGDPCAALQVHINLAAGDTAEVVFLLGQGADHAESAALLERFCAPGAAAVALQEATDRWDALLGAVRVKTPDPAMDLLLNRWLPTQAIGCRLWARTAFYQSSGAYGFRDQLQDVMATVHTAPELARQQLLRAAAHQFELGDVLHWWHPPTGRGVRTRISDDLLWLPYVTAYYVNSTGDTGMLREEAPFLRGEPLHPGQHDRYDHYAQGGSDSLYEHCRRALQRGATQGSHGLPLMGGGDWNDGMDRIGAEGRGESIWLGWFLHATLTAFAPLAEQQGDAEQAAVYRAQAEGYRRALEEAGWDGGWYRRAYDDAGRPVGSAKNPECRIDSIAQSWAALSGAGDPGRVAQALAAVETHLIRPDDGLILLFTPPFDKTKRDPGYIKGYPPGVRENGGQYTHGAIWTAWAFAARGDGAKAGALFDLLNPIRHGATAEQIAGYLVEPYVVAADIYGAPPHTGRGGWTWYTGSASWLYRLGLEAILGVRRVGAALEIAPCIPPGWPGYSVAYRYGNSLYRIRVENGAEGGGRSAAEVTLDGAACAAGGIPLVDDGREHEVVVRLEPVESIV